MSKKKRHYTKGPQVIEKVVEIHKTPTLQEAWDVVCDHLEVEYRKGTITWFVDAVGGINSDHGEVVLKDADQRVFVRSSKNYQKAMWGEW
ncbi:uncharacterized protein KNN_04070 [Bacillus thuringiensis serovar tolworthi]|uniref:Uncharacterized protein n=1 Tax=Bacillus thuringiensis subsp. tolworthi TaxID=1442 RepID=A0A9W4EVE2_BACTO|nr:MULTISPECIES: hypothetical protein [Bacillus cereus group]MEB8715187.1 hypothetical protein [Bacillus cereus]MDR5047629.1 hypothetical protein [Bacillus thuringiensis]MEB8855681.1 hypothetical protein [Bacillus cereus]MEB9419608.1 hypothetical protein [Bacillus cereus]MEB9432982.1 hypothetical protein [Bacillus cereus]